MNVRMYSAGYYSGEHYSGRPGFVGKNAADRREAVSNPRYRDLGLVEYADGFLHGWWGEPPSVILLPKREVMPECDW